MQFGKLISVDDTRVKIHFPIPVEEESRTSLDGDQSIHIGAECDTSHIRNESQSVPSLQSQLGQYQRQDI